jgi:hypothetical protein
MFAQQAVEQIGTTDPEVRQRVIVQRHPATEPAIDVMADAQPVQRPRASDAVARGVQPKRQQQPGRRRRMAGPVLPRLDPILQFAQLKPFDIGPDHPRRMILPDQSIDIDGSQFDLVAHRLAQSRRSARRSVSLRLRLFRQFSK